MKIGGTVGFVLAMVIADAAAATPAPASTNPLATPDQIALDKQALAVFHNKIVQDGIGFAAQAFATDPYAETPEGRATLPAAAKEVAFAAVVDTINRDATRPRLQWLWSPAHTWFGSTVPVSKVLMPNVDNVFRIMPLDHMSHYRITAAPGGPIPTQFSIQLLPALPAESQWSKVIQELVDTDITKSPDGSFTLTIGPESATGRHNHIATTAASHFILIRDTIQDWRSETPYRLSVTRLDGPPQGAPASDADLAAQSVTLLRNITPRIQQAKGGGFANSPGFFQGAANQLTSPKIREGGRWGLSSSGHFHLTGDDALVLTLDPIGAKYLAVQLASAWLSSLDYVHHTASLNLAQTRPNADGTITVVIAAKDPGVANWLDTTGLHDGSMFVRWQKLPDQLAADAKGVRDVRLVKITDLNPSLPRVSAAERETQLAERAAAYGRRFAE
jgi:hypothetical protein